MNANGLSYRSEIDGLRAVAVLSVIAFHYGAAWLPGGFLGVDIFFVISGYLITRNIRGELATGTFSLGQFYIRRVRRIIPALLVTIAATFAAFAVVGSPQKLAALADTALASVLSVSNVYFYAHSGYFDADSLAEPLLHTWSLGVEEQFYFAWPFLLMFAATRRISFGPVAASIGALSLLAAQYFLAHEPNAAFYLTPFRAFEFAIGALITALPEPNRRAQEAGFAIGAALLCASLLGLSKNWHMPGFPSLLPCSGAALIIHCGRATLGGALRGRAVVLVGRISYSLYLVHWPVLVFGQYIAMRELSGPESLEALAVTVTLACGLFYFVETPFRSRHDAEFVVPPVRLIGATLAVAALIIGASVSARADGWPWRLGQSSALLAGITDPKAFHLTYYGGRGCPNGGCQSAPNAKRRVYVLGDSYARAYYSGLVEVFPEINFVFFVGNGCSFYSLRYTAVVPEGADVCFKARSRAFAEIKADPADIILTQDWSIYARRVQVAEAEKRRVADGLIGFADFVSAEIDGLRTLAPDHRLIVLGGVPQFHETGSPFDCISRPAALKGCASTPISDAWISKHATFNREIKKSRHSFEFLDPFDYLSTADTCRNFDDDGKPIYSDAGHLSVWGSRLLAHRMLSAAINWDPLP